MERKRIKDIIREAQTTLKRMNQDEPSQEPSRRALLDGSIVMQLKGQKVPVVLDERLQKRWRA